MEQREVQELRVTFNTDTGSTVQVTVPDADLNNVTSDTAVAIFNTARVPLTNDSTTTLVQSTDGGNVIGIKKASVVNAVYTDILVNYQPEV